MKTWTLDMLKKLKADLSRAHKSWTMVFNAISGALAGIWLFLMEYPETLNQILDLLPQLGGLLDPKTLTIITFGINIANLILRAKTNKPLSEK